MRNQTVTYVQKFLEARGPFANVLDVGSRDVNGNLRGQFTSCRYTGIDMIDGENVNLVVNAHELTKHFNPGSFDLVLCFDTLEHDDKFWLTMQEMRDVLAPGGWMLIGVPGRRCPLHEHPSDYWRFMPAAMDTLFDGLEEYQLEVERDPDHGETEDELYACGRKPL